MISVERLREVLDYNQETGVFTWRINGRSMRVGSVAGTKNMSRGTGYVQIKIDRKIYWAHRLAWLYVYGYWPESKKHIDHINRNSLDNRIANLRLVTCKQNQENRGICKRNTSGYKGVSWDKNFNKWRAQIRHNNKVMYLGSYDKAEDAYSAYCNAVNKFFTFGRVK